MWFGGAGVRCSGVRCGSWFSYCKAVGLLDLDGVWVCGIVFVGEPYRFILLLQKVK